jgi:hypothetical protein
MPIIPIVIVGAAALLGWRYFSGGSMSGSGWSAASGVVLNDQLRRFLDRLAARLSFPIYVTSGIRTPEAQARALAGKVAAGSTRQALDDLYAGSAILEVLGAAWPNVPGATFNEAVATQILKAQVARGIYLSRHMRGDAVDLRVSNLSAGQVEAVRSAAAALGAEVIVESQPPHIHIEEIAS